VEQDLARWPRVTCLAPWTNSIALPIPFYADLHTEKRGEDPTLFRIEGPHLYQVAPAHPPTAEARAISSACADISATRSARPLAQIGRISSTPTR